MEIKAKIISSLEKVFASDEPEKYEKLEKITALGGERVAFQLIYKLVADKEKVVYRAHLTPRIEGELAEHATMRRVAQIPVVKPIGEYNDDYLSGKPGLFPDPLLPLNYGGRVFSDWNVLDSLWIDLEIPESFSGDTSLTVTMTSDEGECVFSEKLAIEVVGAPLPEAELYYTRWFHADCLASYYEVPVWSKKHWEIIENFARMAVRTGVNTLLTPLITPSLDGPRMITQLVKIRKNGDKYAFDFSRLKRWIEMCDRVGIKYFEISHLFTQGGADGAPRIVATVDGEEKMIFSYDTPGTDPEYRIFLRALLTAFLKFMKKRGDDKRCIFHISDEPHITKLEQYRYAKSCVADILEGYKFIDALSDFEFYAEGLVECPVPLTRSAMPFIEAEVPHLWTYYCCGPTSEGFSNSFIGMPSWRVRSLGMQLYKYNIEGFLHWGFNFYNNRESDAVLNPYIDLSGENWVPAGDPFIVYPGRSGQPIESLRAAVFYHALEDLRAMKLCERYYSHEEVVAAIEEILGEEITFRRSAHSAREMSAVREKINEMIRAKLA